MDRLLSGEDFASREIFEILVDRVSSLSVEILRFDGALRGELALSNRPPIRYRDRLFRGRWERRHRRAQAELRQENYAASLMLQAERRILEAAAARHREASYAVAFEILEGLEAVSEGPERAAGLEEFRSRMAQLGAVFEGLDSTIRSLELNLNAALQWEPVILRNLDLSAGSSDR